MNPDTAEMAVVDGTAVPPLSTRPRAPGRHAPCPPFERPGPSSRGPLPTAFPGLSSLARWLTRLRADPARMAAVRDSWRALAWSRLLVWVAGVGTLLAYG